MPATFKALDPATGEEGPEIAEATLEQLRAATAAAARAWTDARLADGARRAAFLRDVARRLRDQGDEVIATAARETGLPAQPRLLGELGRTAGQLEAFAAVVEEGSYVEAILDRADPAAQPLPRPDLRRMLHPIGPVAVFGASNFPLAFSTAGGDTASALAAGCPVVVKGHPAHPETGALVAALVTAAVEAAGLPEGTFALIPSADQRLGEALVAAPEVRAVAFTGSHRAGRALMDRAAARPDPIPVFAEMGSLNPLLVTPGAATARPMQIGELVAASVTTFGGQLCTKPGLVLVPDGVKGDVVVSGIVEACEQEGPHVLLGPGVLERFRAGLDDLPGAVRQTRARDEQDGPGFRHRAVVVEARADALAGGLLEEHFGPAVVVARYATLDDARATLEALPGQLTVTFHAEEDEHAELAELVALAQRRAGRVLFGGVPTGVTVAWATQHGGPYPACSSPATSVGMTAMSRFLRPVCLQDAPAALLAPALQDDNPLGIWRRVDGAIGRD